MPPQQPSAPLAPDVELRWALRGHGWARFTWISGSTSVEIATSFVGDALRDLLRAARDLQLGSSATFTHLLSEPSGHRIFFNSDTEKVYVQIVSFENLHSDNNTWAGARLRWEGLTGKRQLVGSIITMAEQARHEYPDDEYERRWGFPFPAEELSLLRGKSP